MPSKSAPPHSTPMPHRPRYLATTLVLQRVYSKQEDEHSLVFWLYSAQGTCREAVAVIPVGVERQVLRKVGQALVAVAAERVCCSNESPSVESDVMIQSCCHVAHERWQICRRSPEMYGSEAAHAE